MRHLYRAGLCVALLMFACSIASAGTRAILSIEVTKGDNVEQSYEVVTFDDNRARIDFTGGDTTVTEETPYIMTTDGGKTWVMGDKHREQFFCTRMQTDTFFRTLGDKVTNAIDFFNVKTEAPKIRKVLEEPGPEIMGHRTTHVRIEMDARAYAWFLFMKFEYTVHMVDDVWYTTDFEIHPVRQKWLNALTQSGNEIIDDMFSDIKDKLPGPILKTESVTEITNVRKKETRVQKETTEYTDITEITAEEADRVFMLPDCKPMNDKDVENRARMLFQSGRLML